MFELDTFVARVHAEEKKHASIRSLAHVDRQCIAESDRRCNYSDACNVTLDLSLCSMACMGPFGTLALMSRTCSKKCELKIA